MSILGLDEEVTGVTSVFVEASPLVSIASASAYH